MHLYNQTPQQIQQQIFDEIKKGANIHALKHELKESGIPPEAYYFTTQEEHNTEIATDGFSSTEQPATRSTWQIILLVISIIVLIVRVARCSSRM